MHRSLISLRAGKVSFLISSEKNNQESYKWGKKNQESYKWGNRLINAHQHGFLHPEAVLSQFKCDFDNRLTSYDDQNHSITPSRLLKQVNFCFCRQIKLRQYAMAAVSDQDTSVCTHW